MVLTSHVVFTSVELGDPVATARGSVTVVLSNRRQHQRESRTFPDLALYLNVTSMCFGKSLTDCQPQARTTRFMRAHVLSAIEPIKDMRQFIGWNTHPRVAYCDPCLMVQSSGDFDSHLTAGSCIAKRIGN